MPRRCTWFAWSLILTTCTLAFSSDARAADKFWNSLFGGPFNDGAKWQGGVPGAGDVAHFGLMSSNVVPGRCTVSFSADATNQAIEVEDDGVDVK